MVIALPEIKNREKLKSQLNLKKALITVLFVIIGVTVFAQTGKISGKISDKKTGETLIGVTVRIKDTKNGASTDVEGRYIIPGLNTGKYTVEVSYVGYATKNITEVEVKNGSSTTVDLVMEESGSQRLNEVVITANVKQESVNALYSQQKNSAGISDGISAEIIKRSPDRNTGEVLKRVSGASIQDNKFVIVRGLNDRYNTALLNNSPLPSSEPDRKAFSFDVIPSNLIDAVVINKTSTPDLPGDFAGGAVQIKTKDFPATKTFEVNYSTGFNTISTFSDFYGEKKQDLEFLGIGSSSRDLPSSFPSTKSRFELLPVKDRVRLTKKFDNNFGVADLGKALPTQSLQLIFGNAYVFENDSKLGLIASATYSNASTISKELRNDYGEPDIATGKSPRLFGYTDDFFNNRTSLDALANVSYSFGNNKFSLKNILKQSFDNNYMRRSGTNEDINQARKVSQIEVTEKFMINSVLEGDHVIGKNKSKLNWNLAFTSMSNDQPDMRSMIYAKDLADIDNDAIPYQAGVPSIASPSSSGRFYSELNDRVYSGALNYSLPFNWLDASQLLKVGVFKQYKDRGMKARTFGYRTSTSNVDLSQPIDKIFANENIAADRIYISETTAPSNQYDATGDLNGGYAMMNAVLLDKLKATFGVRVENYIEKLNAVDNSNSPVNVSNNYLDILPSVNLTYALTEKANLRMSYSNTVARAQFRELAPFTFYDFKLQVVTIGNSDLKRTQINNFDLRYEFYPVAGQMISVSGFYKKFKNTIETGYLAGSNAAAKSLTYINAPDANLYGLELELRQSLSVLNQSSEFLKSLTLSGNVAIMKSEVQLGGKQVNIENKRQMQGQSPYIINTGLQYAKSDWQASVLYNRIGRRISIVGFGQYENGVFRSDYPNIYEAPRNIVDFQISKKVLKSKGEIKLNVSNILDSDARFYQDVNGDKSYTKVDDQLINSVNYGRTFSLSLGYKF